MIDEPAFKPTSCDVQSDGNLKCDGKEEIIKVEVSGEVPTSGNITLKNGKTKDVQLVLSEKTIIKNSDGKLIYGEAKPKEKTLDDICDYDSTNGVAEKTAGAKYSCEVKDGTSYNFFVLTTPQQDAETINLIMERNICQDGTQTDANKTDKCLVEYNSSGNAANGGPVAAMTYLNNATNTWENIENLNLTYDDESKNFTGFTINGKARLPYRSEVTNYDRTNKTNAYLYDYLSQSGTIQTNQISGIQGYWTLSSYPGYTNGASGVNYGGFVNTNSVGNYTSYGVRPVITLKI